MRGRCDCTLDPGFGFDNGVEECALCNASCKFCTGPEFERCTSCPKNKHLVNKDDGTKEC